MKHCLFSLACGPSEVQLEVDKTMRKTKKSLIHSGAVLLKLNSQKQVMPLIISAIQLNHHGNNGNNKLFLMELRKM